ncbi:MAG: helix-hairpin-helix domain-containing protein [Pedobacter sp.]|nr:MAG: helix-hairpin-helix domain-containing protein [Pedobacter sp.]
MDIELLDQNFPEKERDNRCYLFFMLQKNRAKEFFVFNKKDRIAAFVFVMAIMGSIFVPQFFFKNNGLLVLKQDSVLVLAIDTLQQRQLAKKAYDRNQYEGRTYQYEPSQNAKSFSNGELFPFDPNTISLNEWQRLGLNERTSKTILKYVSKGGKFYKAEDLQKIWGMPDGFYQRVKDYIDIKAIARNYTSYDSKPFIKEERKLTMIDINTADTSAFIALPGIGSKLSARILAFRDKLGGFYSVEQVGETYGLPDSTFQKIKERLQVDENNIRKMNVNTATKDELKAHPYIRWNLANAIVEYRNQHGSFKNMEELKNIALVDEPTFSKISHYLSL